VALSIAYKLICAVRYLHSANLIHRDLKPDNIMLTPNMDVRICDFGFTRSLKPVFSSPKLQRKQSHSCFTRYYRPPEVIVKSSSYGFSADVWSVGCVLSEVFQKTVIPSNKIQALFPGDSCYPLSPYIEGQKHKEGNQEPEEALVSADDQMITILRSLKPRKYELTFTESEHAKKYIKSLAESIDDVQNDTPNFESVHKEISQELVEIIKTVIKINP
jgi:serine/threonine protein kinase